MDGNKQASRRLAQSRRLTDNRNGTITDNLTGPVCQERENRGSVPDSRNKYNEGLTLIVAALIVALTLLLRPLNPGPCVF